MDIRDEHHAWPPICAAVGQTIASVFKVYNVLHGEIDEESFYGLQIAFVSKEILLLEGGKAGEWLRAKNTAYEDRFAGRTDKNALDYQEEFGYRMLIDISNREMFSEIIGQRVQAVYPIKSTLNALSGAQFEIGRITFSLVFVWDELFTLWDKGDPAFETMKVLVDYAQGCKANSA